MMTDRNLLTVTVAKREDIAQDIVHFQLVAKDGLPLPACAPGAHIDVHLPGGFVRQYSICNTPSAILGYEIAVLRDANGRGGSKSAGDQVRVGMDLQISHPRNLFELEGSAGHQVLIAGGIGITPLLSMAKHLHQIGHSFELHYCVRSPERAAFLKELSDAAYSHCVKYYFDSDTAGKKFNIGELLTTCKDIKNTHIYICGPGGFIDMVTAGASRVGMPSDRIHVEHFSGKSQPDLGDKPFEIRLARSRATVFVPADQTALDALHAAGIDVPMSCEQGVCGTCMISVIEGQIDHRDLYLTEEEKSAQDKFLPCCSRAGSGVLTVDL